MPGTSPALSIGLPVYNGARFLRRALESFLGQEFQDFEIIVSDNASEDDTPDICREYARSDSRIRYLRNDANIGLVPNFNRVFHLAQSEFFKWATHDDWCEPQFLSRCIDVLRRDEDVLLACTAVTVHDENTKPLESWRPTVDYTGPRATTRCHRLLWGLGETYPVFGVARHQALARTRLFQDYLGSDRVMLAELSMRGSIRVIPQLLYHYTYFRPAGRVYSVYNNPWAMRRLPLRTWRLTREHLGAVHRSDLNLLDKTRLDGEVLARFGIRDGRRMAAEVYHSGRILLARGTATRGRRPTRAQDA